MLRAALQMRRTLIPPRPTHRSATSTSRATSRAPPSEAPPPRPARAPAPGGILAADVNVIITPPCTFVSERTTTCNEIHKVQRPDDLNARGGSRRAGPSPRTPLVSVRASFSGAAQGSAGRGGPGFVFGPPEHFLTSFVPYGSNGAIWRSFTVSTIILTPWPCGPQAPGPRAVGLRFPRPQVRKPSSWPRSWANSSLL